MPTPVELIQGTLEFLVLETLSHREPMHGFDILEWIQRTTGGALSVEEGSLYPALHRMEKRGWITSRWGVSGKGRRAKFYRLAAPGRRQLRREQRRWTAYVDVVKKIMTAPR